MDVVERTEDMFPFRCPHCLRTGPHGGFVRAEELRMLRTRMKVGGVITRDWTIMTCPRDDCRYTICAFPRGPIDEEYARLAAMATNVSWVELDKNWRPNG